MTATVNLRIPSFGDIASSQEKEDRVDRLLRLYGLCDTARRSQEGDWFANSAYLRGNQLDDLPVDARALLSRRLPVLTKRSKRVAYVANRMLAMYRQAKSTLLDNIGRQIAVPATQEEDDVLSAELATDLLRYMAEESGERDLRDDDIGWTMITGRVLGKVEWDPDAEGQGPNGVMPGAGEVLVRGLSPLQFHMDPWVTNLKDASFVVEVGIRDIAELTELFGAEATKSLKPGGVRDGTYLLDQMLGSVTITRGTASQGFISAPKREEGILTKVFHFAPTKKHPKGLVIWQAGREILHEGPLPEGVMPFVEFTWLRISGHHYPMPFLTPLRSPAHYMNVLNSQMIHLANSQLRGDTIRIGSGEVHQDVDPETGRKDLRADESVRDFQMVKYQLEWTAAAKAAQDMWDDMQQVAGLRGPTIGEHVTGVDTARGQELLREPDIAGMAMFKRGFEESYAKLGHLRLQVAQAHYKTRRLLRVTGADQKQEVTAFLGSDLSGVADVTTESLPMMTEGQRRFAEAEQVANGAYGPYIGPDGLFSIQVKRSKLESLLLSGIPGIDHKVERLAAPMTMDELRQAAAEADMREHELGMMEDEIRATQMEAMLNPAPEEAEDAQDPQEQAIAELMGVGSGEQAQQPAQGA